MRYYIITIETDKDSDASTKRITVMERRQERIPVEAETLREAIIKGLRTFTGEYCTIRAREVGKTEHDCIKRWLEDSVKT